MCYIVREDYLVFARFGGALLSHVLRRSTIGAEGFHGRVRNGVGCRPLAMATRLSEHGVTDAVRDEMSPVRRPSFVLFWVNASLRGLLLRMMPASGEAWLCKSVERLGPVSFTCCHAFTPGLSTWWSSTALRDTLF